MYDAVRSKGGGRMGRRIKATEARLEGLRRNGKARYNRSQA